LHIFPHLGKLRILPLRGQDDVVYVRISLSTKRVTEDFLLLAGPINLVCLTMLLATPTKVGDVELATMTKRHCSRRQEAKKRMGGSLKPFLNPAWEPILESLAKLHIETNHRRWCFGAIPNPVAKGFGFPSPSVRRGRNLSFTAFCLNFKLKMPLPVAAH